MVEGDKDEVELLKNLFSKVFDYSIVNYDKRTNQIIELKSKNNKYSRVFVIPAEYSSIKKFDIDDDYFDNIFRKLSKYELDSENSAIYILFDRDRDSNRPKAINDKMKLYVNSRDNGINKNGLLLMSYPCIQSFYYNCNKDNKDVLSSKELKEDFECIKYQVKLDNLKEGLNYFFKKIKDILKEDFSLSFLDNFKDCNIKIFNYEEKEYEKYNRYILLSMLFVSFVDLGIVEL